MARIMTEEHKAKLALGREARKLAIQNGEIQESERKNPIGRSDADPTSLRKAIDARCYFCAYDGLDVGTWRDQVKCCNCTNCPLHKVRPQ